MQHFLGGFLGQFRFMANVLTFYIINCSFYHQSKMVFQDLIKFLIMYSAYYRLQLLHLRRCTTLLIVTGNRVLCQNMHLRSKSRVSDATPVIPLGQEGNIIQGKECFFGKLNYSVSSVFLERNQQTSLSYDFHIGKSLMVSMDHNGS